MLKATFKSYYRKQGSPNPIFVYTVLGSAKELAEFAQAKADGQGISLDDYHAKRTANGGQYTHTITPNLAKGIGIPDSKVMNLSITPNGKVVVDDTEKVLRNLMEDEQDIRKARNASIGAKQAEIALGLTKQTFTASATTAAQPKEELVADKADDLDTAVEDMQNANKELAHAGDENLDDQPE